MTTKNNIDVYKRFYTLSNEMFCIVNSEGSFIDVNNSFSHNLGFNNDELESSAFIDYIHPDDLEKTNKELIKLKSGSKVFNFVSRFKCKNRTYKTLSWNAVLDNTTGYFYTSVQDITEQVNIKNELKQLKSAIQKETIYAETDLKGNITKVNKKFCEISGYLKDELIGQNHRIVNSDFHPKEFFEKLWLTISSGNVWSGLIQNNKKNGDHYFVQSILIPIVDHNDKIIKYIATRQDITNQINTDLIYQKTLSILTETSSLGKIGGWEMNVSTGELLWTDETFKILDVKQKSGLSPILPEGLQLFIDKDVPIITEAVSRAIEFGEPYSLELQACTPKGEIKWIYTNGKAHYKDGKIETISGIIQDIHETKLAKIKLDQSQQKSIHNAKFAALGELSASIAHEINNPLGVISGYAELIQMQSSNSDNQLTSQTNTILKSCDKIAHIVKSLKKFSRNYEAEPKQIHSIKNIINEAISLTRPKIKQNMIRLNTGSIEDVNILCNEIEIEQIFVNLINNAVEAINDLDDKWIKLSVECMGDALLLRITDSGKGIPEEKQLQIFEPFYTSKSKLGGTGLGLSIVKEILTEHNADIRINNTVKGTCFEIIFPKYTKEVHGC
ncbi:PAS domain-containing sensor histidine kinase [Colwellia piezophila]|uniref:PAS domain-containing sensor histidine kinase n=1 Tax=Colwellia piezophila TaxID=211668 RepID=UPI00036D069B|nr:PAS domain S-box protein [Colwellia piezophila]